MTGGAGSAAVHGAERRAWLLLVVLALTWGINWPAGKALLAYLPPIWLVALRSALGTATLLATCLLVPLALLLDGAPRADWQPESIGLMVYGGVFGIALGYWAMTTVNRHLPAATTSLGLLGVPVFGMACSALALGEGISLPLLGAMGLILGGIGVGAIK